MRRLLTILVFAALALVSVGVVFGQGTPITVGDWTAISVNGPPAQFVGYERSVYASRGLHCWIGNYHQSLTSEVDNAINCYSYAENRYFVMDRRAGIYHNEHRPEAGHTSGFLAYLSDLDVLAYMQDGSGSMTQDRWFGHGMFFDMAGLAGQDKAVSGSNARPWLLSQGTPTGEMEYDPFNHKLLILPDNPGSAPQVCTINPADSLSAFACSAGTSTGAPTSKDFIPMAYNSDDHKVYVFNIVGELRTWNGATDTWTTITPSSCTGNCVSGHPPGRYAGGLTYHSGQHLLVMAGGTTSLSGGTFYTDTWTFNPVTLAWNEITTTNKYGNGNSNATFARLTYDPISDVVIMFSTPVSSPYAQGSWNSYVGRPYAFALAGSTPLNYGRTVNTYTPTSGSYNRIVPTATSNTSLGNQSYSADPAIATDGSGNIALGHIETGDFFDGSTCGANAHPMIQTTPNNGTLTYLPGGSSKPSYATACTGIDPDGTSPGNVDSSKLRQAYVNGVLWETHERWANGATWQGRTVARYWNTANSTWTGGAVGCFTRACDASLYNYPSAILNVSGTPTILLIENDTSVYQAADYLYLIQYSGGNWVKVGTSKLNNNSSTGSKVLGASASTDGVNIDACWNEEVDDTGSRWVVTTNAQLFCRTWNGSSLSAAWGGTYLNQVASSWVSSPSVTTFGGNSYVSWTERASGGNPKVYVGRWNRTALTVIGSVLNIVSTGWATDVRLDNDGTNLYLAWLEQSAVGQHALAHVKKYNGSAWSTLGGNIAADTTNGSLASLDMAVVLGAPTVIFTQKILGTLDQTYVQQYSSGAWGTTLGGTTIAPAISTSSLANGTKGSAYSQTISTTGSPVPTLSVTAGSLPAGLTLSGATISGTPTQVGTQSFTITATNGTAPDATQAYTVGISGSLSLMLPVKEALYSGGSTGVARTNEPFCLGVPIPESESIIDTTRLALTGASAAQFRILGRWSSGVAQWIKACGLASLAAGGTVSVTFTDFGTGNTGAGLATDNGTTISVATGAANFIVKKANFNGLDVVDVGSTHLVLTGASQGVVLLGPDGAATYPGNVTCATDGADHAGVSSVCNRLYTSALDASSTVTIEEDGPVLTVLKATGDLKDAAGHAYMKHTTRLYFYAGKTSVKVLVIPRNAGHGTSNTFLSATKGYQALEFRVTTNLAGTLAYTFANHTGTPTSGTLTNYAYLYQAESSVMKQVTCAGATSTGVCVLPSPLSGYSIISNGSAAQTGTAAQVPQGWADISDSSGIGVEIGQYQFAAYGNKSLEFQNGGNDVRIGLWAAENNTTSTSTLTANKPYYQRWPQWSIQEGWLNFHASAPASLPNEFLKYQHYLVARADYTAYNTAGVFSTPLLDPTEETAYYNALDAAEPPAITKPVLEDMGLSRTWPTQYWMNVWRYWEWETGGGNNQMEFHLARLYNFLRRGWTGGFLDTAHFYKFAIEQAYPMSDGFNWRNFTGEVDSSADPTATSANSSLTTRNWETKYEHCHTYGLPTYYFMTGEEWVRDGIIEGAKDHFLSTATVIDVGRLWNARALGNTLNWMAQLHGFLVAIGDSDAPATLVQGQKAYVNQVRPDLCVNVPGGTSPAGCTVGVVGGVGTAQRGTSKLRGMNYPWSESINQTGCSNPSGLRDAAGYQHGMLINGLLEFRRAYGSTWTYYNESFDIAYGIAKWAQSEMYTSGTSWQNSGPHYYEAIDYTNACDTDYFAIKNLNVAWQPYKMLGLYEGGNGWKSRLDRTIQRFIRDGATEEAYLYTIQDAIYLALHPATALNAVSFTFSDLGAGNYKLSWTVPTGASSYRIKWSPKQIVDMIGFNPGTNTWIGDPITTANWFAATDAANVPVPSGTTQNLTIATGTSGLTAANFAIKAYGGATPPPATAPTVTTTVATSITTTGATSGGTVTDNGGATVTSEGVCYAVTASPTTPCTSDGTATPFTSTLSGLPPGTLIHYRAFATNSAGTAYGSDLTFTTTSIVVGGSTVRRRRVVAAAPGSTYTTVQHVAPIGCGGGATCAVTVTSTTGGNFGLFCGFAVSGGGASSLAPTGEGGWIHTPNIYRQPLNGASSAFYILDCWHTLSLTGGSTSLTWNWNTPVTGTANFFVEVHRSSGSWTLDTSAGATDASCTACAGPTPVTLSGTDYVIHVGGATEPAFSSLTGVTAEFTDHQNYGTSYAGFMAAAINGQSSYLQATWNISTSDVLPVGVVALK